MKIVTQISTFDYEEIEILGDLERCKLLINNVPDEKIVEELQKIRGKGRNDYPIPAVWNSILIMPLIECSTVEQLRRELSRNRDLRKLCGFNDYDSYYGKCKLVPPPKAYSNMFKNLKEIEPILKECFVELRDYMYEKLKNFGRDTGIDGKIFESKAKSPDYTEGTDARSETDADWTIKNVYSKDQNGITKTRKIKYFGFRVHILGDTNYELPIDYKVTRASLGEREQMIEIIDKLPEDKRKKINTLSADKGYDGKETIESILDYGIKPIISIKNSWHDGEETKQYKDTNIVYTYDGKVSYVEDSGKIIPMKYKGYDRIRDTLRYEHKDKIYSIERMYDIKVFVPIARDSKKWQRLYNKRTAIERINGRLDKDFNLENHKMRGLKKAKVIIDIMMIGMMSMAKGHIERNEENKIRCLKTI